MKISLVGMPASAALLLGTLSLPCFAQTARVVVTHVKPEMLNEWLDLQKNEVAPALKKAGVATRTVYSSGLFGNTGEYVTVTPFAKYADYDAGNPLAKALGQPGATRLTEKLRKCTVSQNAYAITRMDELSNVLEGGLPDLIVAARYRIAAGKQQDFQNLFKAEVLPLYKKAKVSLTVNARSLGANPADVTVVTGYSKYADLDGGTFLQKQLGREGAAKLNAKFVGVRTVIEVVVRSKVKDLSW